MSKKMLKSIPATGNVLMNQTPFLGGGGNGGGQDGRNAIVEMETPAAGVVLEGHDGLDSPAEDDEGWFTLLTGIAGQSKYEINLPRWVRRGAAGGTDDITLHGVQ